jgi:predicted NBD/HSP70 family sugar kinase
MQHAIGLDLGGSSAKIALVGQTGEIRAEASVAMPASDDPEAVLAPIGAGVDHLLMLAAQAGWPVTALGCGFSGYLDPTRTVIELNNTPALNGFALESWLGHRFGLPTTLDNDACVAAFAETQLTPLADHRRILFVTIGSGIGIVLVVDGDIVRVMKGVTGDASHIIVDANSRERCPVGCAGCLETVASARALARAGMRAARTAVSPTLAQVLRETGDVSGADVSRAAAAGDRVARDILTEAGRWLGVGLASWASIYAPDLVLLGGAVAQAGDDWLQSATTTMREVGMPLSVEHLVVTRATLGNRAGVIGAALMALRD